MKKHFTKFLPVALALMVGTTGAFAAYTNGSNQEKADLSITVPHYLNIIKTPGLSEASGVTSFGSTYETINLDTAMSADFTVYNNFPGQKIFLRGTTGPNNIAAFGGTTAADLHLVFSNTTAGQQPTDAAIKDAYASSPAKASNPNCFALTVTPTLGKVDGTAATAAATPLLQSDGEGKMVQYTLSNGGYTFNYELAQTADANTFSTHDTDGTYTATLYLTSVGEGSLTSGS